MKQKYVLACLLLINTLINGADCDWWRMRYRPQPFSSRLMDGNDLVQLTAQLFPQEVQNKPEVTEATPENPQEGESTANSLITALENLIYDKQSPDALAAYKQQVMRAQLSDYTPFYDALSSYYQSLNLVCFIDAKKEVRQQVSQLLEDKTLLSGPWDDACRDQIVKDKLGACAEPVRSKIGALMRDNNAPLLWTQYACLQARLKALGQEGQQDYWVAVEDRIDTLYFMFQNMASADARAQYRKDIQALSHYESAWNDELSAEEEVTGSEPEVEPLPQSDMALFIQGFEESLKAIKSGAPLHAAAENKKQ